jgi:hypothetical protein
MNLPNILKILLIFTAVLLLIILVSPLDYRYVALAWIHFTIVLSLGCVVTFLRAKQGAGRRAAIITWALILPLAGFLSFRLLSDKASWRCDMIHVPGSNKVVVHEFYTLFMMGNPRMDLSVAYPFFGGNMLWRSGKIYTKDGLGDGFDELEKYEIPYRRYGLEGLFILQQEGYLVDTYEEKVYPLRGKVDHP